MAEEFDPYRAWLGILPEDRPPHHYRLLGLEAFEPDFRVIDSAACRQVSLVQPHAEGEHAGAARKILGELAWAKACLLNPVRKQLYDAALRKAFRTVRSASARRPRREGLYQFETLHTWVIGSAADCDLVVSEAGVSPRHCELTETAQGFFVNDLGSAEGTFLNGRRITGKIAVCPQDEILLGTGQPMPWPDEVPAFGTRLVRIGRAADNDIVLSFPMVSSHHAVIRMEGGTATIEDLNSTNGLAVGTPANKVHHAPLTARDVVYFGSHPVPAARLLSIS